MEIVLWIIVAICLAMGIARWNESNKTFWILFTCFMVGIAGGTAYSRISESRSDDEDSVKVYPMQEFPALSSNICLVTDNALETPPCIKPNLAGKDANFNKRNNIITISDSDHTNGVITYKNPSIPLCIQNSSIQVDY